MKLQVRVTVRVRVRVSISFLGYWHTAGYGRESRIPQDTADTAGYRRIRQDTAGYGRIRQDTAGYGRIRQDTAGYGRIRQDTRITEYGRIGETPLYWTS